MAKKPYKAKTPCWEEIAKLRGDRPVYVRIGLKEMPISGLQRGDGPADEIFGAEYRTMFIRLRRKKSPGLTAGKLAKVAKREGERRTQPLHELFVGQTHIVTAVLKAEDRIVLDTTEVETVANLAIGGDWSGLFGESTPM